MTRWRSNRLPIPPHPFAHFVANDEWVLISGVGAHDELGNLPEGAADQARATVEKIVRILEAEGSGFHEVVWIRPYIADRAYAAEVDDVLREYLGDPPPGSGALTIVGLADERMKVELEVWAQKGARLEADPRNVLYMSGHEG